MVELKKKCNAFGVGSEILLPVCRIDRLIHFKVSAKGLAVDPFAKITECRLTLGQDNLKQPALILRGFSGGDSRTSLFQIHD